MFDGIPASEIRNRPVIEIPHPQPVLDKKGNLVLRNGIPQFNVTADRMDYMMVRQSPVRVAFTERFIVKADHRAKPTELAIFFFLANTTEWSDVQILVDGKNEPILTSAGRSQAVITTHGNRSRTRTVNEIAKAVNVSYGAAHKALKAWEDAKVIWRIKERHRPKTNGSDTGRPTELRRYEFDPQYVWNGHIWIGNGYSDFLQGPIEVVS